MPSVLTLQHRRLAVSALETAQRNQGIYFRKAVAVHMVRWYLSQREDNKRAIVEKFSTIKG